MVRLTDRPDMTLDVYRGRKTTMQQQQQQIISFFNKANVYILSVQSNADLLLSDDIRKTVARGSPMPMR